MKSFILGISACLLLAFCFMLNQRGSAQPAARDTDPWVGTYLKFGQYDSARQGSFGEAQQITITKEADGYRLTKSFDTYLFVEKTKGVLTDSRGILGSLFLGSVEFSDGQRRTVIRCEFCYEHFILYGSTVAPAAIRGERRGG